ncbi:MAG TPA: hypothetical protein VFA60_08070 [Terriglobales bacterium]|nr:hypothetical protein [Terriglobales bacterium]
MTDATAQPARRGAAAKVMLWMGGILAVFFLLIVGSCVGLMVMAQRRGAEHARQTKERAAPLLTGLDRYRQARSGCPKSLDELTPEFIASVPKVQRPSGERDFHYRCANGRYWLAFDDASGMFLPSDMVYEYDSGAKSWSVMDVSQSNAVKSE